MDTAGSLYLVQSGDLRGGPHHGSLPPGSFVRAQILLLRLRQVLELLRTMVLSGARFRVFVGLVYLARVRVCCATAVFLRSLGVAV